MTSSPVREEVRIRSGDGELDAWYYPGSNGACVVMAGGLAVPKGPATDTFAPRFAAAGYAVVAFDYRGLGDSDGEPRLVLTPRGQLVDWRAAVRYARERPEIAADRVVVWGFSASGGHVLRLGAEDRDLAAVIAQTPNADGPAGARNAGRYQTRSGMIRFAARCLRDALGGLLAAPLLVIIAEQDTSVPPAAAATAAQRAPDAQVVRVPGGHYAPFLDAHEQVVAAELDFLRRNVPGG